MWARIRDAIVPRVDPINPKRGTIRRFVFGAVVFCVLCAVVTLTAAAI